MASDFGSVRYQHDRSAEVVEMGLGRSQVSGHLGILDRAHVVNSPGHKDHGKTEYHRECSSIRGIHNQLIERCNTQEGGWCETLSHDGKVLHRHDKKASW